MLLYYIIYSIMSSKIFRYQIVQNDEKKTMFPSSLSSVMSEFGGSGCILKKWTRKCEWYKIILIGKKGEKLWKIINIVKILNKV